MAKGIANQPLLANRSLLKGQVAVEVGERYQVFGSTYSDPTENCQEAASWNLNSTRIMDMRFR
jgi:hypothetical protein